MTERLFKNLDNMKKRKEYETELSEIDMAIKYHKTIIKFLNDEEEHSLKYHKKVLNSLKIVRKNIEIKKKQVKLALDEGGLRY